VTVLALSFLLVVLAVLGIVGWIRHRGRRRHLALTRLLDSADAFEARLRAARNEIEAMTGEEDETVRTALQEMLRQRLWLQQHGNDASFGQLDDIRVSIDNARMRIEQQLALIERARTVTS
jgi:hypothetical protein